MFKFVKKVSFKKGGTGHKSCNIILPPEWVKEMGVTESERDVEISFQGDKITIRKAGE